MNDDLPAGWELRAISELVHSRKGRAPSEPSEKPKASHVPYIDIKAFETGLIQRYTNKDSAVLVDKADLLVVWDGARCGLVGQSPVLGALGSTLMALSPRDMDRSYLRWYLESRFREINTNPRGIGIPHVQPELFWNLQVPVPPLTEQQEIAQQLGEVLQVVQRVHSQLAAAKTTLKCFRQAVLAAACSGRLTKDWRNRHLSTKHAGDPELPPGWRWEVIEELIPPGGIFDGPFGSNLKTADYTDAGVRVIRLENIGHLEFIPGKQAYISREKYKALTKHTVGEGDIIFASFIEEEIRVCLLPKLPTIAIAKADCFCLRPLPEIDRSYLVLQLASPESYDRLVESIHGATRPRINITQLRKLEVQLCHPEEQREIVRRVKALFALADQIEVRCTQVKAHADNLTQSILSKVFRGELIPSSLPVN